MFNKKIILQTPETLQQESTEVLSVFRQTINKLEGINERASQQREEKLTQIKQLEAEQAQLKTLCNDNGEIINNINNLLNN